MKGVDQSLAHVGVRTAGNQGGGLLARDFHREAGAAQNGCAQTRGHLGLNFVRQQTVRAVRRSLQALAQPGNGGCAALYLEECAAQTRQGRGDDDELRITWLMNHRRDGVRADAQVLR